MFTKGQIIIPCSSQDAIGNTVVLVQTIDEDDGSFIGIVLKCDPTYYNIGDMYEGFIHNWKVQDEDIVLNKPKPNFNIGDIVSNTLVVICVTEINEKPYTFDGVIVKSFTDAWEPGELVMNCSLTTPFKKVKATFTEE